MAEALIRADYLQYSTAVTKMDQIQFVNQVSGGFSEGIDNFELISTGAMREDL